jgi:Ca2+-binding RTX toxin-like protein
MKPVSFEALESRRLLSVVLELASDTDPDGSPFAHLTRSGTLVLSGQLQGDTLVVETSKNGKRILAIGPGPFIGNFSAKDVKRVLVEGGGGQDKIVTNNCNKPATLVGGSGNDILQGGVASTLIGGAGNDKLIVKLPDRIGGNGAIKVISTGDGSIATWTFAGTSTGIRFTTGPSLLSGGAGNDTFATGGSQDSVIGGAGTDAFTPTGRVTFGVGSGDVEGIGELSGVEQIIAGGTRP